MQNIMKALYVKRYLRPMPSDTQSVSRTAREAARHLLLEGRYAEAISLLNAEQDVAQDPLALKLRGVARLCLKDYAQAYLDSDAAEVLLLRELSAVRCNKAAIKLEDNRVEEGLKLAQLAWETDPHWYLPGVNVLSALALNGEVEQAWAFLEGWLKIWPDGQQDQHLMQYLREDGTLAPLRADDRFHALMEGNP